MVQKSRPHYSFAFVTHHRERPAAIPIEIKSIDDTSNFDEFPESDILSPTGERKTDSFSRNYFPLSQLIIILTVCVWLYSIPCDYKALSLSPYLFTLPPSSPSSLSQAAAAAAPTKSPAAAAAAEADYKNKDWVFINYTYKRFEGLTARGAIPSYMKGSKR